MMMLGGIQFSVIELVLSSCLALLALSTLFSLRRIARLQKQLAVLQHDAFREINMVNQGAIGLGRRFSHFESHLKSQAAAEVAPAVTVADQAKPQPELSAEMFEAYRRQAMAESQAAEPKAIKKPQQNRRLKTIAEQSLSRWMNEQKMA